jgi:hypothetical protein
MQNVLNSIVFNFFVSIAQLVSVHSNGQVSYGCIFVLMMVAGISSADSVGRGRSAIYVEREAGPFFLYCNVQNFYRIFYFIFHSELQCGY